MSALPSLDIIVRPALTTSRASTLTRPSLADPADSDPPRLAQRLSLDHPGYLEGIIVSGARQGASVAMSMGLALALGGGHYAVAAVAALPLLARFSHVWVPALVRRHGSWAVARGGFWIERSGFLLAAAMGITQPMGWALAACLAGLGLGFLGQAVYDAAMAALHSEVAATGEFGRYTGIKTRWASLSGLTLGIAVSVAVGCAEHVGVAPSLARALAIATGVAVHCLVSRPFARMGAIAHRRTPLQRAPMPALDPPPATGLAALRPRTRDEWGVIWLALAWGTAYGVGNRQGEAMAMSVLGISVGGVTLLNALLVGAGIIGAKTWGRLADRFGGRGVIAIALAAFALDPLWSVLAMVIHPWLFIPGYVIWGVFNAAFTISLNLVLVHTTGHPADRIRMLTMYNVVYGVAAGMSPFAGGALLTALDGRVAPGIAFGVLLITTALMRALIIPVLRRLPGEGATGRHLSAVYYRAIRRSLPAGARRLRPRFPFRGRREWGPDRVTMSRGER
ncbi:MAG: hypothetical protein NVS1B4_03860 [Gemmatimonadaceae bacterium]